MARKLTRRHIFQLGLPLPLVLAGCSDDDKSSPAAPAQTDRTVELFSWWIAPSEAEALNALIAVHNDTYPHDKIVNAAIESGAKAREVLAQRLADGEPPDLYQENAYYLPAVMKTNPKSVVPITALFTELGLFDTVVPEVIQDVTIDGEICSMPVNIHRENAVHYNKQIFEQQGIEIPTTLEELLAVCKQLKKAGITPFASSYKGWIQRMLFNGLAMASMGATAYKSYFSGKTDMDEEAMRKTIALLDDVLTNYVNDSATDVNFRWTDAADLVLNGEAAMFVHGDWAKGYFTQLGWEPGVKFGIFAMPGATDLFLYGVDVFAMVADGPHPEAAQAFLRTVASSEGQIAFNTLKGSTPIRLDTDTAQLDVVAQGTLRDLKEAKLRMLTRTRVEWDTAFEAFAVDRDADALLQAYIDYPPAE